MGGGGGCGLSPHIHTRLQSLACALVREGVFFFLKKDGSAVLGLFCKKKTIIQTSLHDDMIGGSGGSRFGCT